MDLKAQNWKNFTAQHLHDWQGIWTRYTPTGEVKESFRSLRHFEGNSDKTEVYQLNKYFYAEDNVQQKSFTYDQLGIKLSDEISDHQYKSMQSYFFPSGHCSWLFPKLERGSKCGTELFFKYEHLRHSVVIVYDEQGYLLGTTYIREDSTGYPSSYWSTDLEQLSQRDLQKNWQGTSITITPDLQISDPVSTQLTWVWEGHKTFFLPDGVSISCPDKVSVGTPFACAANWLINETEIHQLIANYDESGKFKALTLERCELKQ